MADEAQRLEGIRNRLGTKGADRTWVIPLVYDLDPATQDQIEKAKEGTRVKIKIDSLVKSLCRSN